MKVISNKSAIRGAIYKLMLERDNQSPRIDMLAKDDSGVESQFDEDTPIQASEMMSTQLAVEKPPVEDPDYMPASPKELGIAASVICEEVPENQVNFFYRRLHSLLDEALDREESPDTENIEDLSESLVRSILSEIAISEQSSDNISDEDVVDAVERAYGSTASDKATQALLDKLDNIHTQIVEDWIEAGSLSDARRTLEANYPAVFSEESSPVQIGIDILTSDQMSSDVQKYASETGQQPNTLVLSVARTYAEKYSKQREKARSRMRPFTAADQKRNKEMGFSKELDELLPEYTYEDIISIYEKRIEEEQLDAETEAGYRDMIDIVRGRIRNPKKRERTDLSVKMSAKETPASSGGTESEMDEEARLKALDQLAPFFGFKNASGLRQWRRKYADPKFAALIGSEASRPAYLGYSDRIFDNIAALLDSFKSITDKGVQNMEAALEENPDDAEVSEMLETMKKIEQQFESMQDASLADEEQGLIPAEMLLTTAAGFMLREAFSEAYFNKQFRDYANDVKKHMVDFLKSQGLDEKMSKTFSKMFNGEVDLVALDSEKRQAEKLRDGGVTPEIYNAAVRESEKFTKQFYTGDKQKSDEKAFQKFLRDEKKVRDLFKKSIDMASEAFEFESKLARKRMDQDQISQLDQDEVVTEIKSIFSKIIGRSQR